MSLNFFWLMTGQKRGEAPWRSAVLWGGAVCVPVKLALSLVLCNPSARNILLVQQFESCWEVAPCVYSWLRRVYLPTQPDGVVAVLMNGSALVCCVFIWLFLWVFAHITKV